MHRLPRLITGCLALVMAAALWLPALHLFFRQHPSRYHSPDGLPAKAASLAARHMRLWREPHLRNEEVQRMRIRNAEWDFMGRSFLFWSLANMALREPGMRQEALGVMDGLIEETLRIEREHGHYHFLLPYAREESFVAQPPRSLFVDGEIALMLGMRRIVGENSDYERLLAERIGMMVERMSRSPVLSGESYPNECWTFCNTVALAAIRVADHVQGTDHSEFLRQWVQVARQKLTDPRTGLLVANYTFYGRQLEGPEGSSLWVPVHCLQLVDEEFAADQYRRARKELSRQFLGFGYAREWPASRVGPQDVDSGPVLPLLGASAGSSGLAFVAAASFGDAEFLSALHTSLEFAGFPSHRNGGLRYCASNQVGDAVLLYSMVLEPVWDQVRGRAKR